MRSRDVRRVYSTGRDLRGSRMVVCVAPGSGGSTVVATRRIGSAVQRNRARRILRAAWRDVLPKIGSPCDVVLVARESIRGSKTQDLVAEMTELLRREGWVRP